MSVESERGAQKPHQNNEPTERKSSFSNAQMGLGAVSLAFTLYAMWNIAPMLPVIGPIFSKLTEPANLFEEATVVGKSKKPDFTKFADAGGLDVYQSWYGLSVSNVSTRYGDDGTLNQLALVIGGTSKWSTFVKKWVQDAASAPPSMLRSTLTKFCGSDNWQVMETGGMTSKETADGKLLCTYNRLNDRSNDLFATIELTPSRLNH